MPNYKHKETGDIVYVPKVKITTDGDIDADEIYDLSEYTFYHVDGMNDFKTVGAKKAMSDGFGIRR